MAQLLVIEDERVLARNITRYFARVGHVVALAHDGRAALELARQSPPDVVIVGLRLPGLDGLEVVRELRRLDAQVHIVKITGHGSTNLAVEAMKAGSMDLLAKPLSLATLNEVVEHALEERPGRPTPHCRQERDRH